MSRSWIVTVREAGTEKAETFSLDEEQITRLLQTLNPLRAPGQIALPEKT